MSESTFYPVVVIQLSDDDGGGFMGYAPDLKGCMSPGETPEEATANAQQAVVEWIAEAKTLGRVVPEPGAAARKAKEARETLIGIVRDQSKAIEILDRELTELRTSLRQISERMQEPMFWGNVSSVALLVAAQSETKNEDSIH
jgi:antitoxin HicB